ncbi:MAG: hypothetical protein H7A13_00365 [Pseudomonadales bacterium]|nr:hypothetical protein [Pseudomonadales bacterium]
MELTNFGAVGVNLLGYRGRYRRRARCPASTATFRDQLPGESIIILEEARIEQRCVANQLGHCASVRDSRTDEMVDDPDTGGRHLGWAALTTA